MSPPIGASYEIVHFIKKIRAESLFGLLIYDRFSQNILRRDINIYTQLSFQLDINSE